MSGLSGSLTGLRTSNKTRILEIVRHRGTTSRADIARRTGLSTTTVSTLVAELIDSGVVVELDERPVGGNTGRPVRPLAFEPSGGGAVGVHLAHDRIRVGVTDLAGRLVVERVFDIDVDHKPEATLELAATGALTLVRESGIRRDGVMGLGVAVSAPVTVSHALAANAILSDWAGVDVASELAHRTGLAVEVGNDANLGAIAEHRFGVATHVDDFLYVMLSDGVGAGLVLDGRLYEGAVGAAGELGHIGVVPGGLVCRCGGRGCLETVAGAHALTAAFALVRGHETSLAAIIDADIAGDAGTRRVLTDAGEAVGRAIIPICATLDPALVVIGGETARSATLLAAAERAFAQGTTPLRQSAIPIRAGALGERAEMLGAVALIAQRIPIG